MSDPAGLAVKTTVQITSKANGYRNTLATSDEGRLNVQRLPYGIYQLEIEQPGFAQISESVDIHSSIPTEYTVQLKLRTVNQAVTVSAANTLINPDQAGAVSQIGSDLIQNRLSSIPGRSLQDLVNSQPGWLYEGNAVLHPRGSEYQTQFVVDGIPLTDNRSPSFGPAIDADDMQSLSIYTAGIPAEYGRKMGGVVEVNTLQDAQPGFHGQLVLSGGSFDAADATAQGQYVWGKNTFGASASGSMTDHYLNPVVPQNYSNTGTLGDFSVNYERDLTSKDRLRFIVRHESSRYDIPNEQPQEAAGQRQTADNFETMGIASYQHTFSSHGVADFRAMARDNSNDFNSNPESTPIEIFQHNFFREAYFKGTATVDHGRNEWKFGVESDNLFLNENFNYIITDRTQFDPGTPPTFGFLGSRPDLEQSAFVQDQIRLKNWTINAGLRWDHYQLILNRQGVDPRLAISRYFPSATLLVHFSYDRVFQTPSFENILLSSSTTIESIAPTNFLRRPVEVSEGNYYEAGLTKVLLAKFKLDANYFRRLVSNYADDNLLENTSISYPIAFRKAVIYGAEAKLDLPDWRSFSGFVSYSYTVGNAWAPVTGGLFLGTDAAAAEALTGHFPDSQDQRHTVRGRLRYQVKPRLWIAGGMQYDTGLPFEFTGNPQQTLQDYGQQVLDRLNFARGRIYPAFQVNASAGADVYNSERLNMRFQIDGQNLTNVLNVIDFGGLFSGNAIGPSRSAAMRLTSTF
ncbi:MAG TPA: TonB-dependent receptor plug domain-containing protein [Terriglobales bacterium]|nr:TonB-dependent receptor plug domain-containing protein [Terriglobales bacterium]